VDPEATLLLRTKAATSVRSHAAPAGAALRGRRPDPARSSRARAGRSPPRRAASAARPRPPRPTSPPGPARRAGRSSGPAGRGADPARSGGAPPRRAGSPRPARRAGSTAGGARSSRAASAVSCHDASRSGSPRGARQQLGALVERGLTAGEEGVLARQRLAQALDSRAEARAGAAARGPSGGARTRARPRPAAARRPPRRVGLRRRSAFRSGTSSSSAARKTFSTGWAAAPGRRENPRRSSRVARARRPSPAARPRRRSRLPGGPPRRGRSGTMWASPCQTSARGVRVWRPCTSCGARRQSARCRPPGSVLLPGLLEPDRRRLEVGREQLVADLQLLDLDLRAASPGRPCHPGPGTRRAGSRGRSR